MRVECARGRAVLAGDRSGFRHGSSDGSGKGDSDVRSGVRRQ